MSKMGRLIVKCGELEEQAKVTDVDVCKGIELGCPWTSDQNILNRVCKDKCMYPLCTRGYDKINCKQNQ